MKKILKRIGLLAAAVMLLWGYQGMRVDAEEVRKDLNVPADSHMTAYYYHYDNNGVTGSSVTVNAEQYYTFYYLGDKEEWRLPVVTVYRADGTQETPEGSPYSDDVTVVGWSRYGINYSLSAPLTDADRVEISGGAEPMQYSVGAYDKAQVVANSAGDLFRVSIDANYWLYNHTWKMNYTFTDAAGNIVDYFEAGINYAADYNKDKHYNLLFYVQMKDYSAPLGEYTVEITDPYANTNSSQKLNFEVVDRITINQLSLDLPEVVAGKPLPANMTATARGLSENSQTPTILWLKDDEEVTGDAEANTTYVGSIMLSPAVGFSFRDAIVINTYPEQKEYTNINLIYGTLLLNYTFTTGDVESEDPGEDKGDNSGSDSSDNSGNNSNTGSDDNNNSDNGNTSSDSSNSTDNGNTGSDSNNNTDNSSEDTDDEQVDLYKIIEGAKGIWYGSTTEGLTIRGDGDFSKFAGVRVDGNWIPSVHYEAKSGSTIVTLKPSYLASLAEGEHTVEIMWVDDSASTTFTVAANSPAKQAELDDVPKTGEGAFGMLPETLLVIAAGLLLAGAAVSRKTGKTNL